MNDIAMLTDVADLNEGLVSLTHPVFFQGQTIEELHMRRPKVRDMLVQAKMKGADAEKEIKTFANLCEVTPALIEELDLVDYLALQEVYQSFLSLKKDSLDS